MIFIHGVASGVYGALASFATMPSISRAQTSCKSSIPRSTFPAPGGKWQISSNGGNYPVWSRDGKELFYVSAVAKMMAVEVKNGTTFDPGVAKSLFEVRLLEATGFDVGKDCRLLIATPIEERGTTPITVFVNWLAGLKK